MVTISHAIIKIKTSNANNLSSTEKSSNLLNKISDVLKTTVIDSMFYEFNPRGVTGAALLKESHITIHTWPEENFVVIDIMSCKLFPSDLEISLRGIVEKMYQVDLLEIVIDQN